MANKYTGSEVAGPGKGKNRPNSKAKVAAREAAGKASGMSAQKFYVKTRMAEAAKSGKTLDRAALRQKFQSGDVARKGFGAPKKKMGGSSFSATGSSSTSSSAGRKAYGGVPQKTSKTNLSSGSGYMQSADTRETVKRVTGGKLYGAKKAPISTAKKGTAMRSADAYGSSKGPVKSAPRKTRFKSKYDNSPSGLQKIGGFLKGIQNDSGTRYVNGVKVKKKK